MDLLRDGKNRRCIYYLKFHIAQNKYNLFFLCIELHLMDLLRYVQDKHNICFLLYRNVNKMCIRLLFNIMTHFMDLLHDGKDKRCKYYFKCNSAHNKYNMFLLHIEPHPKDL